MTVAPEYRRLGLAATLMETFEHEVCGVQKYNAYYFFDLFFVRASNHYLAIRMYEQKFGYTTYRRVLGDYSSESPEDALPGYAQGAAEGCALCISAAWCRSTIPCCPRSGMVIVRK